MTLAIASASAAAERIPPHNLDAEKSVLGSVFIKPAAWAEVAIAIVTDDFFLPAHRDIFDAMIAVDGRQQKIDVIEVADELKKHGMLARLDGGQSYLNDLVNAVPTAENVLHYARIVREKATLRRMIAVCATAQSAAYGDYGDFGEFVLDVQRQITSAAGAAPAARISLVDRALALGSMKRGRLETPFPTLNAATRGGPRPGVITIGGAPGAGKTTLLVFLAMFYAGRAVPVTILAADEGPEGLLIRMGQTEGFDRGELEDGRAGTVAAFAGRLREFPHLVVLDADRDRATVESAAEELRSRAPEGPRLLLVDSLQTVRAFGSAEAETSKARVDAVMAAVKAEARRGTVVFITSEVGRLAYRSSKPADRVEGLAAFKESGSIEYGSDLALVMRSVKDETGLVDVEVVKNRLGSKPTFRLCLDFDRATFSEAEVAAGAAAAVIDLETQLQADMEKARAVLREHPGLAGNDQLIARMGVSKTRGRTAVNALWAGAEIENRAPGRARRLYLIERHSPNSPQLAFHSPGGSGALNSPNSPHPYRGASGEAGQSGRVMEEENG